jgi:hypothetical protein
MLLRLSLGYFTDKEHHLRMHLSPDDEGKLLWRLLEGGAKLCPHGYGYKCLLINPWNVSNHQILSSDKGSGVIYMFIGRNKGLHIISIETYGGILLTELHGYR